jgi:hypothetical protein
MTIRSFHILLNETNKTGEVVPSRVFGKGTAKEYKEVKRAKAIARQQKNIDRGFYTRKVDGIRDMTGTHYNGVAPISMFMTQDEVAKITQEAVVAVRDQLQLISDAAIQDKETSAANRQRRRTKKA